MSDEIPIPKGSVLRWAIQHPEAVREAIAELNRRRNLDVRFVAPSGPPSAGTKPLDSPGNSVLPLPLQFAAAIPNPSSYSGTASASYSQAEVQALMTHVSSLTSLVSQLVAALRRTGQNPS